MHELQIIRALNRTDMPYTATELADQIHAKRPAVIKDLKTLVATGAVERLQKTGPRGVDCFRIVVK